MAVMQRHIGVAIKKKKKQQEEEHSVGHCISEKRRRIARAGARAHRHTYTQESRGHGVGFSVTSFI